MANLPDVLDGNFEQEVLAASKPVLVDFGADWCKPCKQLDPIVEELAEEWGEQIKVVKIDSDINVETTMKFGVMGLPTLILFVSGEEVARLSGLTSRRKIVEAVSPHLAG
jgi:thioredoxin 1